MAFTWGSTALKVVPGTYSPPHCNNGITLIDIIPGTDGIALPIVQQGGADRPRASFEGVVTTYSEYAGLLADSIAATERTYADGTYSDTMIIEELSPAVEEVPGRKWTYSVTFLEV